MPEVRELAFLVQRGSSSSRHGPSEGQGGIRRGPLHQSLSGRGGKVKRGEKNRDLKEGCKRYIRLTKSMPEAQLMAKKAGFSANTSVWMSAFSEMLMERK